MPAEPMMHTGCMQTCACRVVPCAAVLCGLVGCTRSSPLFAKESISRGFRHRNITWPRRSCKKVLSWAALTYSTHVPACVQLCSKCGVKKWAEDFYRSKTRCDGLSFYCKPCHNDMRRRKRASDVEAIRSAPELCFQTDDCEVRLTQLWHPSPKQIEASGRGIHAVGVAVAQ
jgi:hypothetical protein